MSAYRILDNAEISSEVAALPDWRYEAPDIKARFAFATIRDAIAFIVQVAIEAEVMNHHPEIRNSYNVVSFAFCTHDVGNKITDVDIRLARAISEIARRFLSIK